MIPPGWDLERPDEGYFDVRPNRNAALAQGLLYIVAYETASFAGTLAELFDVTVEMPAWLSTELRRIAKSSRAA